MIKYLNILFIIIFTFSHGILLEARKIKLKSKESTSNNNSTYGGINFENELNSFQNDSDKNPRHRLRNN